MQDRGCRHALPQSSRFGGLPSTHRLLACRGHAIVEELDLIWRSMDDKDTPMKAIRIHAYGDASVLSYEDAPRPIPADNEVLVHVHAAGVNPIDWKIRSGALKSWIPHSFPFVPGVDFSGIVEE